MVRVVGVGALLAVALLLPPTATGFAQEDNQNPGLPDLDRATEVQLKAQSLKDVQQVVELCRTALRKGLEEGNAQFAKQLLAAALYQHAKQYAARIPAQGPLDRYSRQLRETALANLDEAIKVYPPLTPAHLLIAKLESMPGGDMRRARAAVDKAIGLLKDDDDERAKVLVLRAELTTNEDRKLADYEEAAKLAPDNPTIWQARAMLHLRRGEHKKAAQQFSKMIDNDAGNLMALFGAAEAYTQLGQYESAIKYLDQAIELEPDAAIGYATRARIQLLQQRPKDALKDLEAAIQRDPGDVGALLLRARVHESLGNRRKARDDVEQVLNRSPGLSQALLFRSMLSAAEKKFSAAIADVQLLLRGDPSHTDARLQLAAYYNADKRPKQAIRVYGDVLREQPNSWRALRGRADAFLSTGQQDDAIRDYETAIKLNPDDSGILNNLAWVLATSPTDELRDGQRAVRLATRACEVTDYDQAHILSTLAAGYAEIGDFDKAIQWSTKAAERGDPSVKKQLLEELESYKKSQPWREKQSVEGPSLP